MPKKFLSFLGTNPYIHTRYKIDDFISKPVRYVQEALAEHLCRDWSQDDKIVILATMGENGSIKKNWENAQINKLDKKAKEFEEEPLGLEEKLKRLNLRCKIEMVPIPDGIEEGEIWKIIQKIYDVIDNNDELYIDITHSFRFIPMIIPAMITFLKTTKNIQLHSIHYGAFEVLGPYSKVIDIDLQKRIAPVRELTELYKMIESSEATNAFLRYGSGQRLIEQIDAIETSKLDQATKKALGDIVGNVNMIDEALKFNNVTELKKAHNLNIEQKIDLQKNPNLFGLKYLAPKLENYLHQWSDDEVTNGIKAAKWCLENDRFAQALTFAHETMITYFCNLFEWNKDNTQQRLAVNFMIRVGLGLNKIEEHNKNGHRWFDNTKQLALDKMKKLDTKLLEHFLLISDWRNIINHAKKSNEKRKEMQEKFPKILNNLSQFFENGRYQTVPAKN